MFSLICVWINGWVNNREVVDLRRYRAHYDVIVMIVFREQLAGIWVQGYFKCTGVISTIKASLNSMDKYAPMNQRRRTKNNKSQHNDVHILRDILLVQKPLKHSWNQLVCCWDKIPTRKGIFFIISNVPIITSITAEMCFVHSFKNSVHTHIYIYIYLIIFMDGAWENVSLH